MNKHLIEFLISLKNASILKKHSVVFPFSRQILQITECLYKEGFIQSYKCNNSLIFVEIRSFFNKAIFKNLRIISTPSKSRYFSLLALTKISSRKFITVLSTDRGLLTLFQCKKFKLGGKALFIC